MGEIPDAATQSQVVLCRAGVLSAVVYSNAGMSVCENHSPVGSLREKTFPEIWNSAEAMQLRRSIAIKECYCTNEVFLWTSITYQPVQLPRAMTGAKVWQGIKPLADSEKLTPEIHMRVRSPDHEKLVSIQAPGRS